MSEYKLIMSPLDGDYYRCIPPHVILKQSLEVVLEDIRLAGLDKNVLFPRLGATWMISRMRIFMYSIIRSWDEIAYHTYARVIENGRYIFYVELVRDGEIVGRFDSVYIPVHVERRKILDTALVEPLWKTPPREAVSRHLERLDMDVPMVPGGRQTVRYSDCDGNRHLTSPAYLKLICDEVGFWEQGDERLMKCVQIDFVSEILPGTEISFQRGERGEEKLLRGYKPDGKLAFSASCIF